LQLQLNEKSSKTTTFYTPLSRYRWLRLPFEISSAMEIYQKRQHEILEGIEGIEVMAHFNFILFLCYQAIR